MTSPSGTRSPSLSRSPTYQVPSLQPVKTTFVQTFTLTPASARSTDSAAPSPYIGSLQTSPNVINAQESTSHLASPVPLELPESVIATDSVHRTSSIRDSSSTKSGGGVIRKLSVTAKASVQSTGQRLRRKASTTSQRRDQSSGPITRRRSDSKNASAGASTLDLGAYGEFGSDFGEDFAALGIYETKSPPTEPPSASTNPEGTAPTVPQQLIRGSPLTKVTKAKRKHQLFSLNVEGSRVSWSGTVRQKYFWIDDIRGFRTGHEALINRQALKCLDIDPDRWLTILYADPERSKQTKSLSVFADSADQMKLWHDTLEALSKHREDMMTGMTGSVERESVIKAHWDSEIMKQSTSTVDPSNASGLQLASIESLCRKLQIHCPKSIIQENFSAADTGNNDHLDYDQFKVFVRRLKQRQDLRPIFDTVRGKQQEGISKKNFLDFLANVQGFNLADIRSFWETEFDRCVRSSLPKQVDPSALESTQLYMDFEAFSSFLVSKSCNVYSTQSRKPNFNRPLNEYFVSSSHNTYLIGRQIGGESSTEAYITALRHGCRCVELDCWDGPDGKPRVTHGRTRTTSVLFSDCITVISRYAFESTPYPLILSLEVHCDPEQQSKMVSHMKEILGERLLTKPINDSTLKLPSPEELKHRILVKVKSSNSTLELGHALDLSVIGRQRSTSSPYRLPVVPVTPVMPTIPPLPSPATMSPSTSHPDTMYSPNERSMTTTSASSADEESDAQMLTTDVRSTPVRRVKLTNIIPTLADLGVYLQGYKFRSFGAAEAEKHNHIFSLDENKANSICADSEEKALFEDHNLRYMSRVYPKSIRIDSSNFDPNTYWRRGVQMVALNWQTYDSAMQMNQAMFATGTDRHGYVLKPEYMRQPRIRNGDLTHRLKLPRQAIKFTVEMISAQQLPRLPDMTRTGSINPFVDVQMFSAEDRSPGIASGTGGEQSSARGGYAGIGSPYSRRTNIVPGNGYNPRFNETFDLSVETKYPELVFVRFVVWHSPDSRYAGKQCKQLAVFTSKLSSLEQGYRHLPLYSGSGEEFIFSTLFCRINKSEPRLIATSLQDLGERPNGRGLFKNMLTRNLSGDRTRERSGSLEKSEA